MIAEASEPAVGPSQEANSQSLSQSHVPDSGYFSSADLCDCICHVGNDLDPTLNGMAALFHSIHQKSNELQAQRIVTIVQLIILTSQTLVPSRIFSILGMIVRVQWQSQNNP